MKQYDRMGEKLDEAIVAVGGNDDNDEAFDALAPGAQHIEAVDLEEGSHISEEYSLYLPQNQSQANFDCGIEFNARSSHNQPDHIVTERANVMSNDQFFEGVRSLNIEQRELFTHIMQLHRTSDQPYCIFTSGGAGTGKSHLIISLYQALYRELSTNAGDDPTELRVLLAAPTGKAAFGIGGCTLHNAFDILPNRSLKPLSQVLADSALNTLRSRYRQLSVCIIDEVSMVGKDMLTLIDHRLRKIKTPSKVFGGVSMIFVGDLFQLKPVMDQWIFEDYYTETSDYQVQEEAHPLQRNDQDDPVDDELPNPSNLSKKRKRSDQDDSDIAINPTKKRKRRNKPASYEELAPNIWKENVKFSELTEIMRQRGDRLFAEMLNRFREGNHTAEDLEQIKTRRIEQDIPDIPHLCCLNATVDAYNKKLYDQAVEDGAQHCSVEANDGAVSDNPVSRKVLAQSLKSDDDKRAGLKKIVHLAVGLHYEICVNLNVEDGLMNGSSCVLKAFGFITDRGRESGIPDFIWVEFHSPRIGREQRAKHMNIRNHDIGDNWVPIFCQRREYMFKNQRLYRVQFPLRSASAKTINCAQGDTMQSIVLDHISVVPNPHTHYVSWSRVTSEEGLYILNVNRLIKRKKKTDGGWERVITDDDWDHDFIKVDPRVREEMHRLRTQCRIELSYTPLYSIDPEKSYYYSKMLDRFTSTSLMYGLILTSQLHLYCFSQKRGSLMKII